LFDLGRLGDALGCAGGRGRIPFRCNVGRGGFGLGYEGTTRAESETLGLNLQRIWGEKGKGLYVGWKTLILGRQLPWKLRVIQRADV